MVQSVKHPTLDLNSGHDLTVHEFESRIGLCTDGMEPAWDLSLLSLSFPVLRVHARSLSLSVTLSQNK